MHSVPIFCRSCGNAAEPEPTTALPGTPEKLEVLAERAARGEALFHVLDPVNRYRVMQRSFRFLGPSREL
jgi:hypothetical protein